MDFWHFIDLHKLDDALYVVNMYVVNIDKRPTTIFCTSGITLYDPLHLRQRWLWPFASRAPTAAILSTSGLAFQTILSFIPPASEQRSFLPLASYQRFFMPRVLYQWSFVHQVTLICDVPLCNHPHFVRNIVNDPLHLRPHWLRSFASQASLYDPLHLRQRRLWPLTSQASSMATILVPPASPSRRFFVHSASERRSFLSQASHRRSVMLWASYRRSYAHPAPSTIHWSFGICWTILPAMIESNLDFDGTPPDD